MLEENTTATAARYNTLTCVVEVIAVHGENLVFYAIKLDDLFPRMAKPPLHGTATPLKIVPFVKIPV